MSIQDDFSDLDSFVANGIDSVKVEGKTFWLRELDARDIQNAGANSTADPSSYGAWVLTLSLLNPDKQPYSEKEYKALFNKVSKFKNRVFKPLFDKCDEMNAILDATVEEVEKNSGEGH